MNVHYAQSDTTACDKDIVAMGDNGIIQHTTIEESVTCKKCQAVLRDKKSLKHYLKECAEAADDYDDYDEDYFDDLDDDED